jgi:3-methyladenine DNA glycosylase AlkD
MSKELRRNHDLALALWARGLHETRLLAVFVDDARLVTRAQMEQWALDFDSWDLCDQATTSLFDQTPHAWPAVAEWAVREEEWVKRGAFAMLAGLAVHDKRASNQQFEATRDLLLAASPDPRNFVKKAVNWAIRNIGKRNLHLNGVMVELCNDLLQLADRSAAQGNKSAASPQRWIARDALRELTSEKAQARLAGKG